jgi:hypothetical protein
MTSRTLKISTSGDDSNKGGRSGEFPRSVRALQSASARNHHVDGTLALEMPFCFPEIDMRALVYDGPRDVSVKKMPDPKIEAPTDVLVRITTTTIR